MGESSRRANQWRRREQRFGGTKFDPEKGWTIPKGAVDLTLVPKLHLGNTRLVRACALLKLAARLGR